MSYKKLSFLQEASKDYCKLIFNWSNDYHVRKNSINKKKIIFYEHKKWFFSKIKEKNSFMWIYFYKKKNPCGLIRIEKKLNQYFLSYLLDTKYRGKKISKTMINEAISEFIIIKSRVKKIYAEVVSDNLISLKVLKSIGFVQIINNNVTLIKLYYEIKK